MEVVSPRSDKTDKADKFRLHAKGGVKLYWIVDPEEETFGAYRLKAGRHVSTGRGEGADVVKAEPFWKLGVRLGKLWWKR